MKKHGVAIKKEKKEVVHLDTPFLPKEIITNILKQLPVKSLIRFQCVCKHWKNLVKSPSFIADHLLRTSNQTPSLLFHQRSVVNSLSLFVADSEMQALDVKQPPYMSNLCHASIVGSCNGLICVHYRAYVYWTYSGSPLFLWNPSIREVKPVPRVILDANNGIFYFGFGYCPIANDYKIVKIWKSSHVIKRVQVYSLNTDSWKEIEFGNIKDVRRFWDNASANGSIFWYASKEGKKDGIVSFDIANEVFTWMPLESPLDTNSSLALNVFVEDKKLVLFCLTWSGPSVKFCVMEEGVDASGGKQWSRKKSSILSTIKDDISFLCQRRRVDYISFYVESLVPIHGPQIFKY